MTSRPGWDKNFTTKDTKHTKEEKGGGGKG
jgi:hypothetical protein